MITHQLGCDTFVEWPVTDDDGEPVALDSATFKITGPSGPSEWTTGDDPDFITISGDDDDVVTLRIASPDELDPGIHRYAVTGEDADSVVYHIETGTLRVRETPREFPA
jgi:dipeptidyl aminopeptidase/acylaminoacyl peptidase